MQVFLHDNRWQHAASDRTDLGGGSEREVFLSLRFAVCQHFGFPIKDKNDETADKVETTYNLFYILNISLEQIFHSGCLLYSKDKLKWL